MQLKLTRIKFTDIATKGVLYQGVNVVGYTIEPAVVEKCIPGNISAIAEGEYRIELRNNPVAGVPSIKVYKNGSHMNISIRASKPVGRNNQSITLCEKWEGTGDPTVIDIMPWLNVLTMVQCARMESKEVTLVIE